MNRAAIILWTLALFFSCNKAGGEDEPLVPEVPTTITVNPETLAATREGGELILSVTAPSRPMASSPDPWISITDGTYKDYRMTFTVNVQPYGEYGSRESSVRVKAGGLSIDIPLVQQGRKEPSAMAADIDKSLVTEEATGEANALYEWLLSIYGKKMVSAVMAKVAWNTEIADQVYRKTGYYPAINCFDFIHIFVTGNWINYNDLTPVTSWADAGGIVSLMWHFNVPKSAGTAVDYANGSGTGFYSGETTFSPSNALKEGTWENIWYKQQMKKVADVILRLQDAGIAAIWRPYHEAAGNYHALNWNGSAWFWWGSEGPEVFKALWADMFDYFKERGIRNLIWVWTAQNHNGDPAGYGSDEAWYPGDSMVDVVARDIYGSTESGVVQDYVQLQATYPNKMITLGECGWANNGSTPFPGIDGVWKAGGTWSWFMPWCIGNFTMVSEQWWKDAFASEYVLTRDDISL